MRVWPRRNGALAGPRPATPSSTAPRLALAHHMPRRADQREGSNLPAHQLLVSGHAGPRQTVPRHAQQGPRRNPPPEAGR